MPASPPTPFDRLSQWLAEGDLAAAEAFWAKRETGEKVPARLVALAAKVAEQDGRWEDALARWQRCAGLDPQRRTVRLGQARALLQLQRWQDAHAVLHALLADEPDHLAAHEMAARVATQLGRPDEALVHWQRAAQDPRFVRPAGLALMTLYEQAGEAELAAQQALTVLRLPGLPPHALKSVLRLMRGTDRWAEALSAVARLRQLEPDNPQHRLVLAQCQVALRDFERARIGLDGVDQLPPTLPAWQVASQVMRGLSDEPFLTASAATTMMLRPADGADAAALPTVQQLALLLELALDARVATLQHLQDQAQALLAAPVLQGMLRLALTAARGQSLCATPPADLGPAEHAVWGLLLARLQQQAGDFSAALATLDGLSLAPLNEVWGGDACLRQTATLRHAVYLRSGDNNAAKLALDQALADGLDRDWAAARALDLRLHGSGQADAAATWAGDVPVQHWQRPFARQDHALALAGSGQVTQAVAQLQARLASRPDDNDARMALAGALQCADDRAGVLAILNPVWQAAGLRALAYADARQVLLPGGVCATGTAPTVNASDTAPLVSVVMTLDTPHALVAPSLRSVLAQTWTVLELLLVTIGPPDQELSALLEQLGHDVRVRVLALPAGTGVARARNMAWQQARGDFAWFSDADAWWHPDGLALQVAALTAQPRWLACRHTTLRVNAGGRLLFRPERPLQPGGVSSMLMRRELLARLGGFDEVPRGHQAEWLQRLVRTLGLVRLGDVAAPLRLTTLHAASEANGADLPRRWFGHDPLVDQYLHTARLWLNDAALRSPVLDTGSAERPFALPEDF